MKMKKIKAMGLFCFVLLTKMCCYCDAVGTINIDTHKSIDIDRYLKRINKTPLKTIESPDGDIIDCVDIYKQPAFDNPLLKNHTLQMRPEGLFTDNLSHKTDSDDSETIIHQMWHENGRCPKGTIPIRRTTKEDLLRAESIERFGKKSLGRSIPPSKFSTRNTTEPTDPYMVQDAMIIFIDKFYGGKASINIWQPHVQQSNEFSSACMMILGGPVDKDYNSIEVGWQVRPTLYGDFNTRLYIHWTSDGEVSTGCFDLKCEGFVQTNSHITLGAFFKYTSLYDGSQYYLDFSILKSPMDGNWWLAYKAGETIGYWPSSLFTHLNEGATDVRVGGQIMNRRPDGKHTTTQMGSGHFPSEGYRRSSFIRNVKVVNTSFLSQVPSLDTYYIHASDVNCYDITIKQYNNGNTEVYHGGPGRNDNCP